jgi:hypothetical protein
VTGSNEFLTVVAPIGSRLIPVGLVGLAVLFAIAGAQLHWGEPTLKADRLDRLDSIGSGVLVGVFGGILMGTVGYSTISGYPGNEWTASVLFGDFLGVALAAVPFVLAWRRGREKFTTTWQFFPAYVVTFFAVACRAMLVVTAVVH